MGSVVTAPVNEAANFLSRAAPLQLAKLQANFPEIADDLRPGMMAGDEDHADDTQKNVLLARGQLMLAALGEARRLCDAAIPQAASRMRQGSKIRFGGQIVTTIASSSVLGALGATKTTLAAISGVLALLASIATLGADYLERLVDPGRGNLSAIYLELVDARYRIGAIYDTLRILIEYQDIGTALEKAISEGNTICELVNRSVYQVIQGVLGRGELERVQATGNPQPPIGLAAGH